MTDYAKNLAIDNFFASDWIIRPHNGEPGIMGTNNLLSGGAIISPDFFARGDSAGSLTNNFHINLGIISSLTTSTISYFSFWFRVGNIFLFALQTNIPRIIPAGDICRIEKGGVIFKAKRRAN